MKDITVRDAKRKNVKIHALLMVYVTTNKELVNVTKVMKVNLVKR
jgi:hypothetical protein